LTNVADFALEVIFNRNLDFGEALSNLAQTTLRDVAQFVIREHIVNFGGGTAGAGTIGASLAGGGVALGGASLLFPQEFANLFEEIGQTLTQARLPRLFHNPESDRYAARQGASVARAFEADHPDARRNARDFADNFGQGFQREIANLGTGDGNLNITINLGENDDAKIQFAIRLRELIEQGQLQFP